MSGRLTEARSAYRRGDFSACERLLREDADRLAGEARAVALYNLAILYIDTRRPDWRAFYDEALGLEPQLLAKIGNRSLFRRDAFAAAVPAPPRPGETGDGIGADDLPPVEIVRRP